MLGGYMPPGFAVRREVLTMGLAVVRFAAVKFESLIGVSDVFHVRSPSFSIFPLFFTSLQGGFYLFESERF